MKELTGKKERELRVAWAKKEHERIHARNTNPAQEYMEFVADFDIAHPDYLFDSEPKDFNIPELWHNGRRPPLVHEGDGIT